MEATLIAVAVLWGALAGTLLPRAAYRFSVEPEEPWRDACPAGHALTGPGRGWLGSTRCAACAAAVPVFRGARSTDRPRTNGRAAGPATPPP